MKRSSFLSVGAALLLGGLFMTAPGYAQPQRQSMRGNSLSQNVSPGHRGGKALDNKDRATRAPEGNRWAERSTAPQRRYGGDRTEGNRSLNRDMNRRPGNGGGFNRPGSGTRFEGNVDRPMTPRIDRRGDAAQKRNDNRGNRRFDGNSGFNRGNNDRGFNRGNSDLRRDNGAMSRDEHRRGNGGLNNPNRGFDRKDNDNKFNRFGDRRYRDNDRYAADRFKKDNRKWKHDRYDRYRYYDGYRSRHGHNDRFFHHYRVGWIEPVRPPVRPWRHTLWFYRPSIPAGFRPYASAPIVDGIIGIYFGTLYDSSLDYLYYNGYNIDGYYDNMVYLSDVDLFGYSWPEVMLRYDNGLNYVQFSYSTSFADRIRYNRLYRQFSASYGPPVSYVRGAYPQVTWLGGDGRGYVTLSMNHYGGRYFTAISFGM